MRPETISTFHPTDPAGKSHPSQTPTSGEPPMLSCPPLLHARTSHSTETAFIQPRGARGGAERGDWRDEPKKRQRGMPVCFFILNGCFTPTHGKQMPAAFNCLRDHHSLLLLKNVINEKSPKAQSPAVDCGSFATPRAPALETPRSVKGKIWIPLRKGITPRPPF